MNLTSDLKIFSFHNLVKELLLTVRVEYILSQLAFFQLIIRLKPCSNSSHHLETLYRVT